VIAEKDAEIARLNSAFDDCADNANASQVEAERLETVIAALREALQEIDVWSRSYPVKIFPEPDHVKAAGLLSDGGMTLDAISADAMRHVLKEAGEIARRALGTIEQNVGESK
jgi:hypothetical protein